jgi:ABC-type transport system involved in cytochrome bd biosynthesis fused ATPase/permease subunit
MINNKDMIIINNNEPLLSDSINKNIIFERDISKYELDKVKKVCLINNDNVMASNKEKIILARNLLSNKNTIILNNCTNNIDPFTERKIIKNIITEYNKNIILISNRKDNMDLFKYFARIKGGKCEKVKYI